MAARKAGVRDRHPAVRLGQYAHALLMANEAVFVN